MSVCPDMSPIAAGFDRKIWPVIQQKSDIPRLHDRSQLLNGFQQRAIRHILQAQLHRGDIPSVQCRRQDVSKVGR